jgi:hypothetical protein
MIGRGGNVTRRKMGMTPGGDLWNMSRATIKRLETFPEQARREILYTSLLYFVTGKPGDEPPTMADPKANAMLQELISGNPAETEAANGL